MFFGLTMVHAEADLVEYFVRANLRLLDHLVLITTPAEDGTQEILEELVSEGLALTIWKINRNYFALSDVITDIANRLRDQWQPDCLFLLDADEILLCPDKAGLRAEIGKIPAGSYGLLPWMTFIPPKNEKKLKFDRRGWNRRMATETQQFWKAVLPRQAGHQEVKIAAGLHDVVDPTGAMKPFPLRSIQLAHLPVRSIAQMRSKTLGSLIAKAIAEGTKWFGTEVFQLNAILADLVAGRQLDARILGAHYLEKDRTKRAQTPPLTIDRRLPKLKLRYRRLIRAYPDDVRVFFHAWSALHSVQNPTESIWRHLELTDSNGEPKFAETGAGPPVRPARLRDCDWPPFEYAAVRFRPNSVLEVGCGLGLILRLFRDRGAMVHGLDGLEWSRQHAISSEEFSTVSLVEPDFTLSHEADLSIFTEVSQRLPVEATMRVIGELTTHTRKAILFSAAQLNQAELLPPSAREPEFWIEAFARHGWNVDLNGTVAVRTLATLHWRRQSLWLLRPGGMLSSSELTTLFERGHHSGRWPCHPANETVIGFPGERWSFRVSDLSAVPPLRIYRGSP